MKGMKIIGSILIAVIGLAAMCLCSLLFPAAISAFVSYVVFVAFSGIIAGILLAGNTNRRNKVTVLCIFIGLVGIAVMQLCSLFIIPPFSGVAGFIVFLIFAAIITAIIINQNKFFNAEYLDFLKDQSKREAALRLIYILKEKGVSSMEIRRVITEKFNLQTATIDELMNVAGL